MCLAVPGRVEKIYEANGTKMGKVDFGGVIKEVCLAYVPELDVGDYTIVHVGFAISQIDEESALETLRMFQELGTLEEELGEADSEPATDSCFVQPSADPGADQDRVPPGVDFPGPAGSDSPSRSDRQQR